MAMDAFSASLMKDKREIVIAPTIYKFDTFGAFAEEFKLGERDVVLTNEFIYKPFLASRASSYSRRSSVQASLPRL